MRTMILLCTLHLLWASAAILAVPLGDQALGHCSLPPRLDFAEPADEHKEKNSFPVGSSVTYQCRPGYIKPPGLKYTSTCLQNQTWSIVRELCQKRTCTHPGEPENGRLISSGNFLFGSRVNYICEEGYRLIGKSSRMCVIRDKGVQWTGNIPLCQRIPCLRPPDIPHGTHSGRYEDDFSYGTVVTYTCEDGYPLFGDAHIHCTSKDGFNGEWSGRAYCGVTECPQPHIENGRIVAGVSKTYKYNQSVIFDCNNGHMISGLREIRCQMDGTWEPPLPHCKWTVRCQPPPDVPNGSYSNQEDTPFTPEIFVNYTCDPGYALIGEATIYCTSSGTWSSPAPRCEGGSCGPALRLEFAELLDEYKGNNSFPIGLTVKYGCRPGYFKVPGLKSSLTCFRNQEWSEVQEFCKRKSCGHPGDPDNGRLIVSGDFLFGSTISYICDEGHRLLGGSSRRCEILGRRVQWTGDVPFCQRIPCFPPPDIPHGTHSGRYEDDFTYGTVVTYTCEDGYPLLGDAHIHCTSKDGFHGEWSGRVYCGAVHCQPPPDVPNGSYSNREATAFTPEMFVDYTCDLGYALIGEATIFCTSSGTWSSPAPRCKVRECPPPQLENGRIVGGLSDTYRHNQSVTLDCHNGHTISGSREIHCQMDGTWEPPLPLCEQAEQHNEGTLGWEVKGMMAQASHWDRDKERSTPITVLFSTPALSGLETTGDAGQDGSGSRDEPVTTLLSAVQCHPPPDVPNGSYSNQKDTAYTPEMFVNYTCDPGYALIGEATIYCTSSGTWSSSAPFCEGGSCGPALRLEFAELLDEYKGNNSFPIGSTVKYGCRPGYFKVPGLKSSITCFTNQEWSEVQEFCKRKSCGHPGDPDNGRLIVSGDFLFGSTISYICDEGHRLLGVSSRRCEILGRRVQWTGDVPFCQRIPCFPPPDIPHGTHSGRYEDDFTYGTVVTYTCEDGYPLLGDAHIHCTSKDGFHGEWSGRVYCGAVHCQPPPDVPNGSYSNRQATAFTPEMFVDYTCDLGYALIGEATIFCTSSGTWSSPAPRCKVAGCVIPEIQNGRITSAQVVHQPMEAIAFECDPGYVLKGNSVTQCQHDNTWDPPVPVCVSAVQCQPPPDVPNGSYSNQEDTAFTPEMFVNYTCDPGYALIGEATIYCISSGTWSSSAPFCEGGSCGPALRLEFAQLLDEYKGNNSFPIGSTVKYGCRPGYFKVPGLKSSLTCFRNQEWSEVQEFCKRKSCGHPGDPDNGRLIVSGDFLFGSTISYICDEGHRLLGASSRRCEILGRRVQWTGDVPFCQRIPCFPPPDIPHGTHSGRYEDDFTYGTVVTYTCEDGYPLLGDAHIHCTSKDGFHGEWSGRVYCGAVHCQPPPDVPNGSYSNREATAFTPEMFVDYTCDLGYALIGEATIFCTSSGTWSSPAPRCKVRECPPPQLENGRIVGGLSDTYRHNQSVTLDCHNGHTISGSREIHCQMDGTWEPPLPLCEQAEQHNEGTLGWEVKGMMAQASHWDRDKERSTPITVLSSTPALSGLETTGDAGQDGSGSRDEPVTTLLSAVQCHPPPDVPNGSYSTQKDTAYTPEMFVNYTCDPGYALIGEATIYCTSSGTWSSSAPFCEGGSCGPALRLEFAELLDEYKGNNSFPIGSTVKYGCRPGYFKVPGLKSSITCFRNQEWSEVQEFCKRKSCGHPGDPDNGRLIVSGDFLFGSTISYICDEGHRLLGASSRRCEILGRRVQWTGDVPFCQRIPCFPPPDIPHGTHSGRYEDDFTYGTVVTYTCEDGYPLLGDAHIHCTSKDGFHGEWSGRVYCGVRECPLPHLENGRIIRGVSQKYIHNQSVTLDCNKGYMMSGSREIRCQMDGMWEPPLPLCERAVHCQPPPDVPNGSYSNRQATAFTPEMFVDYTCDLGYALIGEATIFCTSSGTWSSPAPRCKVRECPPPQLENGRVVGGLSDTYRHNQSVTLDCHNGHTISGSREIHCQMDGTWEPPLPLCEQVVHCQPPPDVPNGSYSNQKDTAYTPEMFVNYTCDPGYALIGEATIYCTSSGTWSSSAPFCEGGSCGPALRLEFAELLDEFKGNNSFPIGSTVKYGCRPGYFKVPGLKSSITCFRNQEWSEVQEFCKRQSCGHPGDPDNGRLIVSGDFLFGSTISYICDEGHRLLGASSRRCEILGRRVQWTGDVPFCQRIPCFPPPDIPHGTHSGRYEDDFTYGTVVTYTCEDGYPLLGDAHIHCTSKDGFHGEWSSRVYCGVRECPPPQLENGRIIRGVSQKYIHNQSVTLDCNKGYMMSGSREIRCQMDGMWEPPLPLCERAVHCQPPPDVPNGSYSNRQATAFTPEMFVDYTCDLGYALIGEATIFCTSSGTWSSPAPRCKVRECPPPQLENGRIVGGLSDTYRHNQSVTLDCHNGHTISGSREIHCQMDGTWEPPLPLCEQVVHCQPPPDVPNGSYSNQKDTAYTPEMFVNYTCDPGYALIGEATIYCTSSGTWSSSAPFCEGGSCGPALRLEFAELLDEYKGNNSFPIGSTVKYGCRPGYFKVPGLKSSIICFRNQEWSEVQEFCKRQSCGHPGDPDNGRLIVSVDFLFGSTISYICDEGHRLLGASSRRCEILGRRVQWTGDVPFCQRIPCFPPPDIPHGTHSGRYEDDFTYGTVVTYTCEDGYPLLGDAHIHCTSKDGFHGEWSGRAYCGVRECPPPHLENGRIVHGVSQTYIQNQSVMFDCNKGYTMSGSREIRCQMDGTWEPPLPHCEQGKHPQKQQLGHEAHVDTGHNNEKTPAIGCILLQISGGKKLNTETVVEVGDNVTLECEEGFVLKGSPHVQCQHGSIWDPPVPVCKPGSYMETYIGFGAAVGVLLLIISGGIWVIISKRKKDKYTPGNRKIYRCPESQVQQ
uniref:Complement receptor type 1 isoform X3 n=1 Tax=Pogona vitticeps TaxID=103695 RepID=A0ABM5G6P6_9SAUR